MDISDMYETAVLALEALEGISPFSVADTRKRAEAILALRDFIRSADHEREANNTRSAYRCHIREGERKS